MTNYDPQTLIGKTAVDNGGDKIGKIGQVYLDDRTGEPAWITVSTGLLGSQESFAPLDGVQLTDDDVRLAVTKDQVKDAPNIADDAHLTDSEQEELYRYYSQFGIGTGAYTDDIAGKATAGTTTGTMAETGYADPATSGTRPYRNADSGDAATEVAGPGTSRP
jgi:sporulation protein YlmC with PRC-barrel domain